MNNNIQIFGGNLVMALPKKPPKVFEFARCSYHYYQITLTENIEYLVSGLGSYVVFFPPLFNEHPVLIKEDNSILHPGDSIEGDNQPITLQTSQSNARVLIAGVEFNSNTPIKRIITRAGQHYKVVKPWGHELWLNGDHPKYCLKEISIKAGTKTSLQYHNFKEETNILFRGNILLHYETEIKGEYASTPLSPVSSIHVTPKIIHRLEALEDTLLYETSTPFLEDVIRIEDDTSRTDGRIDMEHKKEGS